MYTIIGDGRRMKHCTILVQLDSKQKMFSKVRHKTVCRELMPAVLDSNRPLKLECLEMKNSTSVHPTQEV